MSLFKEKIMIAVGVQSKTISRTNNKPYPPFGKQFQKMRQVGNIPARMIMVVFPWKLAKRWPRIVIPDDISYKGLNFDYLAGLPVEIAYKVQDAHKVNIISQDILAVNPSFLSILELDLLDTNEARTLLKPYALVEGI